MTNKIQYGFYFDATRCTGCKTCQVSCKDRKDLPVGINWRRVYEYAGGQWNQNGDGTVSQDVFAYYTSIGCNHCSEPACTKACPTGAMHKRREDGLVLIDAEICIGCGSCARACPYDAPQIDNDKGIMTKCDGCYERLAEGLLPTCVESCPQRALDFGVIDELRAKYPDAIEPNIAPLPSTEITHPNLIIKPNRNAKPTGDKSGQILNWAEV
ncbi:DMSO/selenate family reductase complex B subunit [Shewanella dokdonensis]|uniref:Dimethylsulfoxide reductase subunit B n=1 Tax=Shewanella dokdonensis TaxID=712036 RepID=A0ABX8DIB4_9GAMM|nr:DMSO/selenate family reductase complex B subunit [Shewanella dokdonensis]MCL1075778.1 dimethylsulfoxide reductase subunit B [Shewanella dokdonensis]QVK24125.1 dimethylsulfoxide reductase subunit B [Shewanella dokdonensis]